uniref:Uncharacterized protein n=1 Tax=Caenorhabditis japonica TaxID=281687 RepID=A0A8R1EHA4_CAEJA
MRYTYSPDKFLDKISKIPLSFEKPKIVQGAEKKSAGYPWRRIGELSMQNRPIGRQLFVVCFLSITFGFATASFGAKTFDHINLKIDSFRDRMEIAPYK